VSLYARRSVDERGRSADSRLAGLYERLVAHIAAFAVVYGIFLSLGEAGPGDCLGLLASKTWPTAVRGQLCALPSSSRPRRSEALHLVSAASLLLHTNLGIMMAVRRRSRCRCVVVIRRARPSGRLTLSRSPAAIGKVGAYVGVWAFPQIIAAVRHARLSLALALRALKLTRKSTFSVPRGREPDSRAVLRRLGPVLPLCHRRLLARSRGAACVPFSSSVVVLATFPNALG